MTDDLTTLLHDTAQRVPARLHPAADVRRNAQHHQRVRRTGAAVLAVALLAGAIGLSANLSGGKNNATELPANRPLTEKSLLVPAEIHAWGPFTYQATSTTNGEETNPAESCLRGAAPMKSLGAKESGIWTRSFESTASVQVRQIAAEFPSQAAASQAFATIQSWFADCLPPEVGQQKWPLVRAAGGRAETVFGGSLGLTTDDPDAGEFAFTSYGVVGDAVTVITLALIGQDANFMEDPLGTTAGFALHRLAGTRTATENAIPADFRFAEERVDAEWRNADRDPSLTTEWYSSPCRSVDEAEPRGSRPSDALRTGMLSVTLTTEDDYAARQVALYPDEQTARAVADELRSEYTRCASIPDEVGGGTWVVERVSESPDITVQWSRPETSVATADEGQSTSAIAIASRGNAVLVVDATSRGSTPQEEAAVRAAEEVAEEHVAVLCEIADCP